MEEDRRLANNCSAGVLPGVHLHCFVRGGQVCAAVTVKMKLLEHVGVDDTIYAHARGERAGGGAGGRGGGGVGAGRLPQAGVDVVLSPHGAMAQLKAVRPSQLAQARELAAAGWGAGWDEVDRGQLVVSGGAAGGGGGVRASGSQGKGMGVVAKQAEMVLVEVAGESRCVCVRARNLCLCVCVRVYYTHGDGAWGGKRVNRGCSSHAHTGPPYFLHRLRANNLDLGLAAQA